MVNKDIHWDDEGKKFNRDTGESHVFKVRAWPARVLDMEDINFHFDSAVLLPDYGPFEGLKKEDERVTGLAVLRTCLKWQEDHTDHKLLIAGHTDRSGSDAYNLKLSRLRAQNVFFMLTGVKEEWVKICQKKHQVEDYQQILKWVAAIWGWDCDPGPVNNQKNAETRKATKNFQQIYSDQLWAEPISVDGAVGPQTWGAFYEVYERVLTFIAEVDEEGLAALRGKLNYVRDDRKWVGCGENHPITPERTVSSPEERRAYERSATDRRVELMFFLPEYKLPVLDCHPSEEQCIPEVCWVYNARVYRYKPIIPIPIPPLQETWVVRILKAGTGPISEREALGNTAFKVTGSGGPGEPIEGTTDGKGFLRVRVYSDSCTMKLEIAGSTITLKAGSLREVETGNAAVKHRLYNMGYGGDKPAEWSGDDTKGATKSFQEAHEVGDKQGTLDGPTKDKVKELYLS